ncbi:putative cell division control protein [Thozetella sp. PMI_491]|nr:putative cell division control protein [Thozetella sp. PMI_491]
MEALLSLAFDNLSSYDVSKVKKGLKQVEGLLAQLCLSLPASKPTKKPPPTDPGRDGGQKNLPAAKELAELSDDPAFREFFRLQEGFEWNIAQRILQTLDRLVARGGDGQNDIEILLALSLLQGLLLLHPPSKALFSREIYMNLLLDLIEPVNCPGIQCATLLTLVVALIDMPQNTRTFEQLDGLLAITSLFRSRETTTDVKLKLVEFLYFYLLPETPSIPRAEGRTSPEMPAMLQRSPSKLAKAFSRGDSRKRSDSESSMTRSIEEKRAFLERHVGSVEDLMMDLEDYGPFGGALNLRG